MTVDWVAERLRRDEAVAALFIDWHVLTECRPLRRVVQAAESYRQWCVDTRAGLLCVDVETPFDVEAFCQQWSMSAEASEIRVPAGWGESAKVCLLLAPIMTVIAVLVGHFVVATVAAAIAVTAYVAVRKAEPLLLVGPAGRAAPRWLTGVFKR